MPGSKTDHLNLTALLTEKEQRILARPAEWRWVSTVTQPDVRPVRAPHRLEWARDHGHAPAHRELFLVLSGRGTAVLANKVFPLSPGVVVLINSRELHLRDASEEDRDFRHLWLHTPGQHVVSSNLNEINSQGVRTDQPLKLISGNTATLLNDVWDRCEERPYSEIHFSFLKSLVTSCLFEAVSNWKADADVNSHQMIVESVCTYIDDHLKDNLNLQHLSQIAGYSPFFFHRLFLRYKRVPIHRYVIEARLEKAKQLLMAGQSVSAVSEAIGIDSASYFSRFFKQHTTIAPSDWAQFHERVDFR